MRSLIFALVGVAVLAALLLVVAGEVQPAHAATFTVTKIADTNDGVCDSDCSLREAIGAANAAGGLDTIDFAIPGPGPHTITPLSPLPNITDAVIIDGYSQSGAIANTNTPQQGGSNAVLQIELDGSQATIFARGLLFVAGNDGSVVKGLVINQFFSGGIQSSFNSGSIVIEGNFIGTNVSGAAAPGNQSVGVSMGGSGNRIGGTAAAARNVISGNSSQGVEIGATGNLVQGNLIGTDVSGTAALGNGAAGGVRIGGSSNTIGGTTPDARNIISANGQGVVIQGATGILVQGNFIGTQVNGIGALGNSSRGVFISSASDNTIGGTANGAGNIIAFNGGGGVVVTGGTGNAILSNSIFSNTGLGIDLGANGVTNNDPDDLDTGANNLQNFPLLTSATSNPTTTNIAGTLNSTAGTTFRLEFFSNTACDPSNHGEGETFLGSTTATTVGTGAIFSVNFGTSVPVGQFITATATNPLGDTSEFSQCEQVTLLPLDHFKCYEIEEPPLDLPQDVTLEDQFGAADVRVQGLVSFCNPVDKNGEGIDDATAHLACYRIEGELGFSPRDVLVENQFGAQSVTVQPQTLCVPSEKDGVSSTDTVTITDIATGNVAPTPGPCDAINPLGNGPFDIFPQFSGDCGDGINEFTLWTFDFTDHSGFNAFKACGGPLTSALLTFDQTAGSSTSTDTVGIAAPAQGLGTFSDPAFTGFNALSGTQTVQLDLLNIIPAYTAGAIRGAFDDSVQGQIAMKYQDDAIISFAQLQLTCEVPNVLDHFKCYEIEAPPFEQDVTLEDQFGTEDTKVRGLASLCNPVDKNGEGINDPTAHLACYKIKGELGKQDVLVENQFGAQTVTVGTPKTLCVPSSKTP